MKHLDLFSGIGGFALATEMVWEDVEHTFCDIEPFSQAILRKHWPKAYIYHDIRTLTADAEYGRCKQKQRKCGLLSAPNESKKNETNSRRNRNTTFDLLTGGFPCQPFSTAGKRRGTEDDRHLWPEMLRVIREFHPRWVIGENVGGFVTWSGGLVLEQVHTDLENEGYEVQAFVIPAVAVNAPHRRDRVWIVAHAADGRREYGEGEQRISTKTTRTGETGSVANSNSDATNNISQRLERSKPKQKRERKQSFSEHGSRWDKDWTEVAAEFCTLDDGLPNGLARPRGWRNAALKGAGNAIVPQVAAEIMKAIKIADTL